MGQFPVSQTDIASLVYAPQWKHTEIQFESRHFNQTEMLVLVPASQTEVLQHLQKWFNGAQVIQLNADSMDRVPTLIESGKISCIAFISVTPWCQGVDEAAIISFLRLIKTLAKFAHVRLDILTVKSICSPAIESVTHPADAVYIGMGQTAAKEFCGWDVRCCSLSTFSQENVWAALQGSFDVESGTPISLDERNWWTNILEPKELLASAKAKGFKQKGAPI